MLESQLQLTIQQWLKKNNYFTIRMMAVKPSGTPDLLVVTPAGNHVYMEVKTFEGRLSSIQQHIHTKMRGYNLKVHTVRSLSEVKEIMNDTD